PATPLELNGLAGGAGRQVNNNISETDVGAAPSQAAREWVAEGAANGPVVVTTHKCAARIKDIHEAAATDVNFEHTAVKANTRGAGLLQFIGVPEAQLAWATGQVNHG